MTYRDRMIVKLSQEVERLRAERVALDGDELATIIDCLTLAKDEGEIDKEDMARHDGLIARLTAEIERRAS